MQAIKISVIFLAGVFAGLSLIAAVSTAFAVTLPQRTALFETSLQSRISSIDISMTFVSTTTASRSQKLDFRSEEYRTIRTCLEQLIRFAHELTVYRGRLNNQVQHLSGRVLQWEPTMSI